MIVVIVMMEKLALFGMIQGKQAQGERACTYTLTI